LGGGDLEAAHRAYAAAADGLRRAGYLADVLGCSITLADIRITQGRLGEALRTFEQALRLASSQDGTVLRGTADMYTGMSQIAYERNDLPAARQQLLCARELGEQTWLPQNPYRWRVAMARVREAEGDLAGALDLLDEAQRVYLGDFSPNVRPIPALRARVLVCPGPGGRRPRLGARAGLSATDDLSYLREFEHVTLARVLAARSRAQRSAAPADDAARLLRRLLEAAEAGERTGSVIEILVLQALTHDARGDVPAALARAGRAPAALLRPRRPRHRPRAHGLPEHPANAHQEHLRQARRQQPPSRGTPGGGAQPAVAHPRPLTSAELDRRAGDANP
jgi:LuxR family maltose regulon positive regulatory protein